MKPQAKPLHDFNADGKSDWSEIVAIFKENSWEWGGDWKFTDMPHFQYKHMVKVRELSNYATRQKH